MVKLPAGVETNSEVENLRYLRATRQASEGTNQVKNLPYSGATHQAARGTSQAKNLLESGGTNPKREKQRTSPTAEYLLKRWMLRT
jgi:hypothetical protein